MYRLPFFANLAIWSLIFLLAVLGVSCHSKIDDRLSKQEIAVFESLIPESSKDLVVIDNSPFLAYGFDSTLGLSDSLNKIKADTSENYFRVLEKPPIIENGFRLSFGNLVINGSAVQKGDLDNRKFLVFSRVGFSNDGKQAVVWFSDLRSKFGSKGGLYLLQKTNGNWEIADISIMVRGM